MLAEPADLLCGLRHDGIWIQPRPGADSAMTMIMAMTQVIIGEGLYDHDFAENWTYGFGQMAVRRIPALGSFPGAVRPPAR